MGLSQVAYGAYERRLLKRLDPDRLPRHVGAIVDGNRRWAKDARMGLDQGYRAGAAKVDEFLDWCHELGVGTVTFWVLSTDNLQRPEAELASILDAVENGLGLDSDALDGSRAVLNDFGNMSSATLMFVLARLLRERGQSDAPRRGLAMAFGPGLAAESFRFNLTGRDD